MTVLTDGRRDDLRPSSSIEWDCTTRGIDRSVMAKAAVDKIIASVAKEPRNFKHVGAKIRLKFYGKASSDNPDLSWTSSAKNWSLPERLQPGEISWETVHFQSCNF